MKISVVVPVYNEQLVLAEALAKYVMDLKNICKRELSITSYKGKDKGVEKIEYELIVVNDGSTDETENILTEAARVNRNIKVINLDTRYGKQVAVAAGMEETSGDCVMLADVDVRNPLGVLEHVFNSYLEDSSDIILAYRERQGFDKFRASVSDGFVRFASAFFGVEGRYTGRPHIEFYSRDVADVITVLPHKNKTLRAMDNWIDYPIKKISFAAALNNKEESELKNERKEEIKSSGEKLASRDTIREHSLAAVFAKMFWALAAILFVTTLALIVLRLHFAVYFFMIVGVLLLLGIALMLQSRAALIKRIGHTRGIDEIDWKIKSALNFRR